MKRRKLTELTVGTGLLLGPLVYALSLPTPAEAPSSSCEPAPASAPEQICAEPEPAPDPELTPGASATFYSLDYDTGTLTPVAEGTVNAEGAPITNPGQGIPELTWIGVAIGD